MVKLAGGEVMRVIAAVEDGTTSYCRIPVGNRKGWWAYPPVGHALQRYSLLADHFRGLRQMLGTQPPRDGGIFRVAQQHTRFSNLLSPRTVGPFRSRVRRFPKGTAPPLCVVGRPFALEIP